MEAAKKKGKTTSAVRGDDIPLQRLLEREECYSDLAYPKISIIIPTLNNARAIPLTLESVFSQDYPDYEVIVIDGGSTDRTLEVVRSFPMERTRIYSVAQYSRYEMLNKGIAHADGLYCNFLFPGDFYLNYQATKLMMELGLDNEKPHLIYAGCVLHETTMQVRTLNRPLTLKLLKSGRQPTSLQSCWFRIDVFKILGKFPTDYAMRGGFDLLCRFCLHQELRFVASGRVLTDYDLRGTARHMVFQHFWETMRSLFHWFGLITTLDWLLFRQTDVARYVKSWFRSLRIAFVGR
jgi:glycosyltransferase involved in cell wall biosynthesis